MVHLRFILSCAAALSAAGCASENDSGGGGAPASTTTSPPSSSSTGSGGNGAGGGTGGEDVTTTVVVNEISARGEDWIELGNPGPAPADLGSFGLCDTDANGTCNVVEALRFPDGTQLAPGAYLLIVGNQAVEAGPGPHTTCLPGGPSSCFYVTWKVSASRGESVFIVSPRDQVLSQLAYPIDAVLDGQTWGRLPDLTGEPAANAPTPGGANASP